MWWEAWCGCEKLGVGLGGGLEGHPQGTLVGGKLALGVGSLWVGLEG